MPDFFDRRGADTPDGDTVRERMEPKLEPGTKVGDYVVSDVLGEGGFGIVYSAVHPLIGKRAAVKVLNKELSKDKDMVSRFVAEARAVNTIRHPNIVDIFNIGVLDDTRHYFVMELLEGESLEDVLGERVRIDVQQLLEIMRGITGALDAAHAKGIVHRDIKPDNIFLHREPSGKMTPKLVDFGVAKLTGDAQKLSHHQTATGAPIGTPRYMSPEQCFAKDIDHRTDIYALGIVCYEALTGVAPFEAESLLELMNKHTLADRPKASEKCPALGPAYDGALARMMAVDPEERPQSGAEAFALLEAAMFGRAPALPTKQFGSAPQITPTAMMPLPRDSQPSSPDGQRRSMPQATEAMFDDQITLPTPTHGTPAIRSGAHPAVTGGGPLAHRHPTTLGATSTGVHFQNRKPPLMWLVAGVVSLCLIGIVVVMAVSGESSADVTAETAAESDDDSAPAANSHTAEAPTTASPTSTVAIEPPAPTAKPSAEPSAKPSAKPQAKPPPVRRRRYVKPPKPAPKDDPFARP